METPDNITTSATPQTNQDALNTLYATNEYQKLVADVNLGRSKKGLKPLGNTNIETVMQGIEHGVKNKYLDPSYSKANVSLSTYNSAPQTQTVQTSQPVTLNRSIDNKALETSTSLTQRAPGYSNEEIMGKVNNDTSKILQRMKDNGETFTQAFAAVFPRPSMNLDKVQQLERNQKMMLFADVIKLIGEGVTGFAGGNVYQRDQYKPQAALASQIANEYAKYQKEKEAYSKAFMDAASKDMEFKNKLFGEILGAYSKNIPMVTTKQTDKSWERQGKAEELALKKESLRQGRERISLGWAALGDKDKPAYILTPNAQYELTKEKEKPVLAEATNMIINGMVEQNKNEPDVNKRINIKDIKAYIGAEDVSNAKKLEFVSNYMDKYPGVRQFVEKHSKKISSQTQSANSSLNPYSKSSNSSINPYSKSSKPVGKWLQ